MCWFLCWGAVAGERRAAVTATFLCTCSCTCLNKLQLPSHPCHPAPPMQSGTDHVRHFAGGTGGDPISSIATQRFAELDKDGSGRVSFIEVRKQQCRVWGAAGCVWGCAGWAAWDSLCSTLLSWWWEGQLPACAFSCALSWGRLGSWLRLAVLLDQRQPL